MRHRWIFGLVVVAGPAWGEVVSVEACDVEPPGFIEFGGPDVTCEVKNLSDVPIASALYGFRLVQEGRTVPWAEGGYGVVVPIASVPGGIEPGETVPVTFDVDRVPERADPALVRYEIEVLEARDVNGAPIGPSTPTDPSAPMTDAEKDAFHIAVQGCWNVGSLSSEAMRTVVTVEFSLTRDGKVDGDVILASASGGSEAAANSAFAAALRAILRCQGQEGYPLPPEKYEQWRHAVLSFDAEQMTVR